MHASHRPYLTLYSPERIMRLITFLLLSGFATSAMADQPVPADLQPLPPPPPYDASGDVGEPGVTISKETAQKVEEFRVGGRLYMIKVTPKKGPPYYLVDDRGDGTFARQRSLDSGFRPPQWVIKKF
jgi:hypothetical protein